MEDFEEAEEDDEDEVEDNMVVVGESWTAESWPTTKRSRLWDRHVVKQQEDILQAFQKQEIGLRNRWLKLVAAGKWDSAEAQELLLELKKLRGEATTESYRQPGPITPTLNQLTRK